MHVAHRARNDPRTVAPRTAPTAGGQRARPEQSVTGGRLRQRLKLSDARAAPPATHMPGSDLRVEGLGGRELG
jgi:hypothetical protein